VKFQFSYSIGFQHTKKKNSLSRAEYSHQQNQSFFAAGRACPITALKSIPGVRQINLYFDDEQF
jgi:hypothetical protein